MSKIEENSHTHFEMIFRQFCGTDAVIIKFEHSL